MSVPSSLFAVASAICAGCDGHMVITYDAIGRARHRCPRCDGVAHPRPRHPDDAMLPQGLVRAAAALPQLGPGQIRCQVCARGIDGDARFCEACSAARAQARTRRACHTCAVPYTPSADSTTRTCASCVAKAKAPKTRLCTGCNRLSPHTGGPRVVDNCSECRPVRVPRVRSEPRSPRVLVGGRNYREKPCAYPRCGAIFQATGPRSLYCEAHR